MTDVIPVRSATSVTRGNPSLEEKYGKIDHFSSSDGFPRVTDVADLYRDELMVYNKSLVLKESEI